MKQMITKEQIKLIHTAKSVLDIDDETYRDLLDNNYNVSSSTQLSYNSAKHLISFFNQNGFKPERKHNETANNKVIKLASSRQHLLIDILKANIVWHEDDGYRLWLKKRMNINKLVKSSDASKVIEGLKGMLGIKTDIIFKQILPLPIDLDKENSGYNSKDEVIWFFDNSTQKLIGYSINEMGIIKCLTKK